MESCARGVGLRRDERRVVVVVSTKVEGPGRARLITKIHKSQIERPCTYGFTRCTSPGGLSLPPVNEHNTVRPRGSAAAVATLCQARARTGGRTARHSIGHRCCRDAALVEEAAEARDARRRGTGVGRRSTWRPKLLGDGCEPRPHRLLQVRRVHGLSPHLAVPAEDLRAERVGHAAARLVGVDLVPPAHAAQCTCSAYAVHVQCTCSAYAVHTQCTQYDPWRRRRRRLDPPDAEVVEVPRGVVVADVAQHAVAVRQHLGHVGHALPHVHDHLAKGGGRLTLRPESRPDPKP
eukprot:scaffold72129_cov81-Phaeocystis_antarctica.AAC.1